MGFIKEEMGQVEDIFTLAIKIALLLLFFSTIAYSYNEYQERKEPMERFSAGLDFADVLKNHVMCVRVGDVPNPGLIDVADFDRFGYEEIRRYWSKPYNFEVVIRDTSGSVLYEQGTLQKEGLGLDSLNRLKEVSAAYTIVAIRGEDDINRAGRMEVWVWS
ncbi:MAG: hypothetical protein V3V36_00015 [Candidatus Hydrothermarchaeaceae archaeon]